MKQGLIDLLKFDRRPHWRSRLANYLRVVTIWCPVATLIFSVGLTGFEISTAQLLTSLTVSIVVATTCMVGEAALAWVVGLLAKRQGILENRLSSRHQDWLSLIFLLPGLYLGFMVAEKVSSALGKHWEIGIRDYGAGMIYGLLISGALALFQIVRELKEARRAAETRMQKLENENLRAQVSALTAQMNPHLLFNTLNTIASAISTDPNAAETMVVQLAEIYRGVLSSAREDEHSLAQELQLCRAYLDIEKQRFGSRINYLISVAPHIDPDRAQMPVLLLQPLIENAIQHGLQAKLEGGSLRIEIQREGPDLVLSVTDDGVGPEHALPSRGSGSGLANARARLRLKFGENSKLNLIRNGEVTTAQLQLPYREVSS